MNRQEQYEEAKEMFLNRLHFYFIFLPQYYVRRLFR